MSIFDQFRFSFVFWGLDVCQRILSDRPVSSNIWQSGQAVIVVILRARLQSYRTVILRSICSEKKTYFRNSRVTLPRQASC